MVRRRYLFYYSDMVMEKELKKVTEERDQARRECRRLKRMLGGAYSLIAAHGIELDLTEIHNERISDKII